MTDARTPRHRRSALVMAMLLGTGLGGSGSAIERTTAASRPPRAEAPPAPAAIATAIGSRGRIQPKDGVLRIAGPSNPSVVLAELTVEEGDAVAAGQVVARLDDYALLETEVARLAIERDLAASEERRHARLVRDGMLAAAEYERVETRARVAAATLARAEAARDRSVVRAPCAGRILAVHARAGERVGTNGIAELGRVDAMYAVAEVYETDVPRVRVGQRATVASPVFAGPLVGTVERIGMVIGKDDVLDVDPVADADARVVEVQVRLDDGAEVAALTRLQVEVTIHP